MKDVTSIFLITAEGGLKINKIEARTINEFNIILKRDKGGKLHGDYDGRNKAFAFKELMYVYLYNHPSSIYRDLPDEARHLKSIEHVKLEDWKPDDEVKAASKKFVSLLDMSALYHSYVNANKGVYSLGEDLKFINKMRDRLRTKIIEDERTLEETALEEEIQKLNASVLANTNKLIDLGIKVTSISNSLPAAFDTIEKLRKKLMEEGEGGQGIYGGGDLNNREA